MIDFTVVLLKRLIALSSVACAINPAATFLSMNVLKFVATVVAETCVLASTAADASEYRSLLKRLCFVGTKDRLASVKRSLFCPFGLERFIAAIVLPLV